MRTNFAFRVDTWIPDGESIVEHTSCGQRRRRTKKFISIVYLSKKLTPPIPTKDGGTLPKLVM
jgi:hypothetical protein